MANIFYSIFGTRFHRWAICWWSIPSASGNEILFQTTIFSFPSPHLASFRNRIEAVIIVDEVTTVMKTVYEVQQLLKQFGTIIYTGDRSVDLELMEEELRELHQMEMIDSITYQKGRLLLRTERAKIKE
jgi:uncharacterized protein YqgQ